MSLVSSLQCFICHLFVCFFGAEDGLGVAAREVSFSSVSRPQSSWNNCQHGSYALQPAHSSHFCLLKGSIVSGGRWATLSPKWNFSWRYATELNEFRQKIPPPHKWRHDCDMSVFNGLSDADAVCLCSLSDGMLFAACLFYQTDSLSAWQFGDMMSPCMVRDCTNSVSVIQLYSCQLDPPPLLTRRV